MMWWTWLLGLLIVRLGTTEAGPADLAAPRFIVQPRLAEALNWTNTAIITTGSSVTIQCGATGNPPPKYRWMRDGLLLNDQLTADPKILLPVVSHSNSGVYRCLAENSCGSILSKPLEIKIAHITQFDAFANSLRRIKAGEGVILHPPSLSSVPPAKLSWLADGLPINDRSNNRKYVLTRTNALVILDAGHEESTHYRVDAYNEQLDQRRSSPSITLIVDEVLLAPDRVPPQIIVPPVNLTVEGDQEAVFECIINARPLPQLHMSWRGTNGASLHNSSKYLLSSYGRRLTIVRPTLEDEGFYECFGDLPNVGMVSHRAHLTVGAVPAIVQPAGVDIQADLGQSVVIPCGAEGRPTPTITWYHNTAILNPSGTDKLTVASNASLIVSQIIDQTAGGCYQCVRQNSLGDDSVTTWLRIKRETERSSLGQHTITILEGQPVQLPCGSPSTSFPQPSRTWFFNDTPISTSNPNYQTDSQSGDLLMSAIRTLAGNYSCLSQTAAGSSKTHTKLVVSGRTRISTPPKDTRLVIGSNVVFSCGVTRDPGVDADIQWYQDGRLLDAMTRTTRRQVRPDGYLEITSARSSDIGSYTCRVFSSNGNDSQTARLDVIELPYPPHIRVELINGTKSVNVSWVPDFDGNSPVIGFVLSYKQLSESADPTAALDIGWQTLLDNFSATDRFYIVKDLRPSASYQFRVSAVNNVGEGSPSAASGPILLPQTPPTSYPKFAASARNSTAVMVQWQPPPESEWNGILRGYVIRYRLAGYSESTWAEITIGQEARRNFILDDMIAWKQYEIQMAAFNDKGTGVWSESTKIKTQEGVPEAAPTDVAAQAASSTSLTVTWSPPDPQLINGINQGYVVELWNNTSAEQLDSVQVPPSPYDLQDRQSHTFSNLLKSVAYNVTVLCFTSAGKGPRSPAVVVTTLEDTPGQIQALHIFNIRDRTLDLSWKIPDYPNGVITAYTVECAQVDEMTNSTGSGRSFRLNPDVYNFTITDLQPLTNYLIKVFASTKMGNGEARIAKIRSSVPPTLPCAPANIQITDITARNVTLQFEPVCDGNTSILQIDVDIQTRDMSLEDWRNFYTERNNVSGNRLNILGLMPFVEYRVRLTMENVVGPSRPSLPSDWFLTLPDSPQNPPGNFSMRAVNATAIRARWTPLITSQWNGKPGLYRVLFRSLNDSTSLGDVQKAVVNDSTSGSLVIAGLNEFTMYEARIEAMNLIGSSETSGLILEATRESVPSSAPENVVAHGIGSSVIAVQWENITAADQNGIILGYKILYTPGNGAAIQVLDVPNPVIRNATLTCLEKYKEYIVQVAGYTRIGTGLASSPVMERTLEDIPDRPYNVFFPDVSGGEVRMVWEPPMRPNGVILGYRISYKLDGTFDDLHSAFLPGSSRSFLVGGLFPDKRYTFTLAGNTSVGWGSAVETSVITTTQSRERPERTARPGVGISMIQPRSLLVSWQPGRPDENAPVRCFQVQYASLKDEAWRLVPERVDGRTSSYTVAGLVPHTAYKFRVQAINDVGSSEWSNESDPVETAEDVPDAVPSEFNAVPYTTTSLTLSWHSPPESALNGRLAGYTIQFHRLIPGVSPAIIPYNEVTVMANTSTYNLTDLVRDTVYELRMTAFTAVGPGPFSSPLAVYVGEAVPVSRPTNIGVEVTSATSATINWIPAGSPPVGSGIPTGYKLVYVDSNSGWESVDFVEPEVSRHSLRSLQAYTTYTVYILSFNAAGDGPRTAAVNFTTLEGLPGRPASVSFEKIQLNQLTVRWTNPERLNGRTTGFEISYHCLTCHVDTNSTSKRDGRRLSGPNDTSISLSGLEESGLYRVSVRAETIRGFGNSTEANVTTGPQPGSPDPPQQVSIELTEAAVRLRWLSGPVGGSPLTSYLIQAKRDDSETWDTAEVEQDGKADQHEVSYLSLAPSTRYNFRVAAENKFGVSRPSEASAQIQTPNWNSVVGLAPRKPFYMEIWFLILVAATGSVFIILLIACLCIKSKAAKYRQEVEKVISTADILQFPEDDEFASPTAFELRQSMRRSTRKPQHIKNNIYSSSAAAASIRRNHVLVNAARAPPFTITPASVGIVPSIVYSDIGDVSDIYPLHVNRGFVTAEDDARGHSSTTVTSRASSSLTEKPSEHQDESSTDEVDDENASKSEPEEPDEQASSFVGHYANVGNLNTLRKNWHESVGTSESRRSRLPAAPPPPRAAYRKSTAASVNGSIAGSDATSVSLNGQLLINNKPGSRNPLPGFSSFV